MKKSEGPKKSQKKGATYAGVAARTIFNARYRPKQVKRPCVSPTLRLQRSPRLLNFVRSLSILTDNLSGNKVTAET